MSNAESLITRGDKLFSARSSLMSLWQELADNFYVERADFTSSRTIGEDFAANLQSSYPLIVRRELGNAFSGMLRPRNLDWFRVSVEDDEDLSRTAKSWLEMASRRQRKAMYDRESGFVRATKEGDHDFATFGQCVVQTEWDWSEMRLLYLCWHLRDVAWCEGYNGTINEIHRNWQPTAGQLARKFPGKLHENVVKSLAKDSYAKVNCRVVAMPTSEYDDDKKRRRKWMHVVVDVENQHIMEEVNRDRHGYTIPRWQTVSGSQYAYSPATVAGLPDARLIQAMTLTLLEAGEMAVRPPVIATKDAIREDVQWYPGGITWADIDYDERKGDVLRPISQDKSGIPFGMEFAADMRAMLATAFYLNKLSMPQADREMTAYEAAQRVQEYIREAVPLFEPMETDYNGALCDDTFELLQGVGLFGSPYEMPEELRGRDVRFKFESPLHEALERKKGITFLEAKNLLREAAELDQASIATLDVRKALREALSGVGTPADWLADEDVVEQYAAEMQQQRQAQAMAAQMQEGATAIEQMGKAGQALSAA